MSLVAPPLRQAASRVITPFSREAMGLELNAIDEGLATNTWTANLARYVSFGLAEPVTVKQAFWENGTAVAGNVAVAIHDFSTLASLVTTGAVAQSGTSAIQVADVTDTLLGPGRYWLAFASNNGTAAFIRANPIAQNLHAIGVFEESSAYTTVRDAGTITPGTPSNGDVPVFGFTVETVL